MLRYWIPLYAVAIILQVYFAGEGIFGAGDDTIENANSLELHRGFGWIIAQPIALLFLITALLAWLPDKRQRWMTIALPFLLFIQSILPSAGRWVAALHPVNAFLLLGLFGYLSWSMWRTPAGSRVEQPALEERPAPEPV